MKYARGYIIFSVLSIVALAITGCGKSASQSPSKQQVQDAVAIALFSYLSLDSIELEPISTGPETAKVNYKATVFPKEDLCQIDREVEGTPKVTLLKVVQPAGTKASFYGFIMAHRIMDKWTLKSPQTESGLDQFGKPRGAFSSRFYITGTAEASAALRQQVVNAENQKQARKVALARQERERIARAEQQAREKKEREEEQAREEKVRQERQAREEKMRQARAEQTRIAFEKQKAIMTAQQKEEEAQKQKEEEALRQNLLLATIAGTRYIGTISSNNQRQRIRLVFTEQKNFLVRVEASNPDKPNEKQTFTGELFFDPKPEKSRPGVVYAIALSSIAEQKRVSGRFYFYERNCSLKLRLTDAGLEGEANTTGVWPCKYTIRLQREGGTLAKQQATSRPARPYTQKDPGLKDIMLARAWVANGNIVRAMETYSKIIDKYPGTTYADQATKALTTLRAPKSGSTSAHMQAPRASKPRRH